jgi:oxygen-dependent protoporphyrinogen oxidase
LSIPGKLRALFDLVTPASNADDESIESFFTRRLGREVAARIACPLLSGIYAGDANALSIRSTFPQLCELERNGGLIRGLTRQARAAGGRHSPFYSLSGGMGRLIERLAEGLGAAARTGAPVRRIVRHGSFRFTLELESGEKLDCSHVLLCCPAHAAARLVPDPDLSTLLAEIPYVSTATVFAALRRSDVRHALDGVGFVATPSEAKILAGTWVSSKWPGRAPEGQVLCRAFLGGPVAGQRIETASDEELVELGLGELKRLMGPIGQPLFTRLYRFVGSNPQPVLGHRTRLSRIRERLRELPGLELAGAAYDGVGIPDCIRQGRAAARSVLSASAASEKAARAQVSC